jgi:curved DNA-binding protein CbpA
MITHYEVLGVEESATSKELKKGYIKLALCLHPDKNVGMNEMVQHLVEERFLEVQEAYETLSDDARRKEYDAALAAVRSAEGEYYVPADPNQPAKQKGPARCNRCQNAADESPTYICGGCRQKIAALEKEVKARRQLGVTACKLCGCKPLVRSPVSGVCHRCWVNIANEVSRQVAEKQLVVCPKCGWMREPGRDCPHCLRDSFRSRNSRQRKQSVGGIWKLAGWSIAYVALSLSNGRWEADFFIILAFFALYLFIKKALGGGVGSLLKHYFSEIMELILYATGLQRKRQYNRR